MPLTTLTIQVLTIALAVLAALLDTMGRRIPNRLILPGAVAGLVANYWLSGPVGLLAAAGGAGLAVLIYVPIFRLRGMSAGHLKLMLALGCLLGPHDFFWLFVLSSMINGLIGIFLVLLAGRLWTTLTNFRYMLLDLFDLRAPYSRNAALDVENEQAFRLPYGAAVALASIASLAIAR